MLALLQDQASRWRCTALAWDVRHTCAHFTPRKQRWTQRCWIMLFTFARRLIRPATRVGPGHRIRCGLPLCAESVFGYRWSDRHDIEGVSDAIKTSEGGMPLRSTWARRTKATAFGFMRLSGIHIKRPHLVPDWLSSGIFKYVIYMCDVYLYTHTYKSYLKSRSYLIGPCQPEDSQK